MPILCALPSSSIHTLQVTLIEKMEVKAKELEAEVQRGEGLQTRVAELQVRNYDMNRY